MTVKTDPVIAITLLDRLQELWQAANKAPATVDTQTPYGRFAWQAFVQFPYFASSFGAALEEVADWREGQRRVMSEDCPTDEKHCTCVPDLKRRIAELEANQSPYCAYCGCKMDIVRPGKYQCSHCAEVDDSKPVDPEGDAAYWRARAEKYISLLKRVRSRIFRAGMDIPNQQYDDAVQTLADALSDIALSDIDNVLRASTSEATK